MVFLSLFFAAVIPADCGGGIAGSRGGVFWLGVFSSY